VNLWLGRLYETTDQPIRAWSRFVEAALQNEPPIGAMRGLDRLNQDEAFRAQFSMTDAGRLLEGRLPVFMPVRQYDPEAAGGKVPVRLVELFTNVDEPATQAAEMAAEALRAYLDLADTVFVQYHLKDPLATDGARTRASAYGIEQTPVAVFDGTAQAAIGGDDTAAPKVFADYAKRAVAEHSVDTALTLEGKASWQGDRVRALASIRGNGEPGNCVLHLLLCERVVMAIGANGQALHHDVVRARLSPENGWPVTRIGEVFRAEATLSEIRRRLDGRLDEIEERQGKRLPMRSTWIDPNGCDVVAICQDVASRRVQATAVLPRESEETRP
jgi:hypothetical protein